MTRHAESTRRDGLLGQPYPHPWRQLWPGRHRRQYDRDRNPENARSRGCPAADPDRDPGGLAGRRALHAPGCCVHCRTRHHAAAGGRLLRLRSTGVWRSRRFRGRMDRLDHLLRSPWVHFDRNRRVHSVASAIAWRTRESHRDTDARGAGRTASGGTAREQPFPGNRHGREVRRVPGDYRRGDDLCAPRCIRSNNGVGGPDVQWPHPGPPGGRDHIRRMAERLVLRGRRPRSGPQSAAVDDRRCGLGHRRLPARQYRVADGSAAR